MAADAVRYSVNSDLEELFDKISNNGREWAQLVNRIRIVFERPTYIFPVRDAVYLWHTYRQKVISRTEVLELISKIINLQDSTLSFDEEQIETKVSAMWKHKHQLNDRRMFDLSKKFLNLPFVPVFITDSRLPFTEEMLLHKPLGKKRSIEKSSAPASTSTEVPTIKRQYLEPTVTPDA